MSHGKIVNRAELAHILGVAPATVSSWIKRGCPYEQMGAKGKEWLFNTAQVATWREEQAALAAIGDSKSMDIEEARRRKIAAEASIAELDLSVRKGELVEIDSVAEIVGQDYANCRARLLNVHNRLIGELTQDQCDMVEEGIREALEELSAYGSIEDSDS